jgi:hypothetical protein
LYVVVTVKMPVALGVREQLPELDESVMVQLSPVPLPSPSDTLTVPLGTAKPVGPVTVTVIFELPKKMMGLVGATVTVGVALFTVRPAVLDAVV